MTKEELIKNQFPNDEFLQSGVLQIVDKCIADLEKENKELKTVKIPQLERRIASIHGAHSVDCRKLNARTEQVERLKKENAELKSDFIKSCKVKEQGFKEAEQALERKDKQLTKAKELLRMVIDSYNHKERFSFEKDLMKAEQFLNSEEEKGMTENSNVPECPSIKIGCDKMYYVDEVEK